MKRCNRVIPFLGGMLSTLLLCACITSALAATDGILMNQVNVQFGGMTAFKKGVPLETKTGAEIPSTITYTDEQGELTTYVPLRSVGEILHMPVIWVAETETAILNINDELSVYTYPLYNDDITFDHLLSEVTPITPEGGTQLLPSTDYQSLDTAFRKELTLDRSKGHYVSITVTNHSDQALVFNWGRTHGDGYAMTSGQIPGGQTITRTIKMLDQSDISSAPFFFSVGHGGHLVMPVNITVSAAQFDVK